MKNQKYLCFIGIVWVVLILPFVGMTFWATNETTENTELAKWPQWKKEDGYNQAYLQEMGTYFEDHFAFRQAFVTANAVLRAKVLHTSATDQVVLGDKDWLYFSGTLADYTGTNLFSEREQYALIHNMKLMQSYIEAQGSQCLFLIPPNKNTLYDENMPYYYQKGETSNLQQLSQKFAAEGIAYLDLYEIFRQQEEVLYFQRDSHWNNQGALLAYTSLMEQIGRTSDTYETYRNVPRHVEQNHVGDLDEMLYPLAVQLEADTVFDKTPDFVYINDVTDNMDEWIETKNPKQTGSILMYRDSFGESLLPFVADAFGTGYFSRLVPYNLLQVEQYRPDVVVIEKVERNLDDFIWDMPIMECPQVSEIAAPQVETSTTIETKKAGSFLEIKGRLDESYLQTDTEIYVAVQDLQTMQTKTYQTFYTATEDVDANGYHLYLKGASVPQGEIQISVIAVKQKQPFVVADTTITWSEA